MYQKKSLYRVLLRMRAVEGSEHFSQVACALKPLATLANTTRHFPCIR